MTLTEQKAKEYAIKCHTSTNHFYDGNKPYEFHLQMVVNWAEKFIHLIPEHYHSDVLAACWCHDVIEDCRQTHNDVLENTNVLVADYVFACTNEKGKTRKDRANWKFYYDLRQSGFAMFVKICDRLANIEYSVKSGSSMLDAYRKEASGFRFALHHPDLEEMFVEMDNFLKP